MKKAKKLCFQKKYFETLLLVGLTVWVCVAAHEDDRYQALRANPDLHSAMGEDGLFHIDSESDLEWFLYYINEGHESLDGILEADVDMAGKGWYGAYYDGHFDGNGHTLRNSGSELFLVLEENGRVDNLTLEDVCNVDENHGCGAVVWYNYGEITGCRVSGYVRGLNFAGGIVGTNFGLISDCVNEAEVVSTQTGESGSYNNHSGGYGAGGIAGYSGTTRREEGIPARCAIVNCVNRGDVTAQTLAGGVCARLEDRTRGGAANNSVQEMVEGFGGSSDGACFSLINCKNYGTVCVERRVDVNGGYTCAAGICGDFHDGDLYHCANLGKVLFSEDAPAVSEDGRVYANRPIAIAPIMGFAPVAEHHIVDCVNLKGTIAEAMRHENVCELTEEEFAQWEAGELTYTSNNWKFDLEDAVGVCSLEPLHIEESELSREKDSYYLCGEFALFLPECFEITEQYADGDCYALRVGLSADADGQTAVALYGSADSEAWLLRKTADVRTALSEIRQSNTLWRVPSFIEEVYATLPNSHILGIDSLNLPGHGCFWEETYPGKRIFMKNEIPAGWRSAWLGEGDHELGTLVSIPLEGNPGDGYSAEWLLVFADSETNIRPSDVFIRAVEGGFYPLDGDETLISVRRGDYLSALARKFTGDGGNWEFLAGINGIADPDWILEGQTLLVPNRETWEKKTDRIPENLLY